MEIGTGLDKYHALWNFWHIFVQKQYFSSPQGCCECRHVQRIGDRGRDPLVEEDRVVELLVPLGAVAEVVAVVAKQLFAGSDKLGRLYAQNAAKPMETGN